MENQSLNSIFKSGVFTKSINTRIWKLSWFSWCGDLITFRIRGRPFGKNTIIVSKQPGKRRGQYEGYTCSD
ncbi:hypothetical protein PS1_010088 [Malus domestica]